MTRGKVGAARKAGWWKERNPIYQFKQAHRAKSRGGWTALKIAIAAGYSSRQPIEAAMRYEQIPMPENLVRLAHVIGWRPGDLFEHFVEVRQWVEAIDAAHEAIKSRKGVAA